jgi:hypothetical protein
MVRHQIDYDYNYDYDAACQTESIFLLVVKIGWTVEKLMWRVNLYENFLVAPINKFPNIFYGSLVFHLLSFIDKWYYF